MRRLFSITKLLVSLCSSAKEPTAVTVFSAADQFTRTLTAKVDLSQFHQLWSKKIKQELPPNIDWTYSIRISTENKSALWLYHPSGWVKVLSKTVVPVYKLGTPEDFNHLLGIHNLSLNQNGGANPQGRL